MYLIQRLLLLTTTLGCFGRLSALTQDQIDFFWNNGYLVIENFLSEGEINLLLNETNVLVESCDLKESLTPFLTDAAYDRTKYFTESGDKISYFFESDALDASGNLIFPLNRALNKIGHNLHDLNPVFNRITYQPKFTQIPKDLGWISPSAIQSMVIFKQPLIGGAVPCHQDLCFLYTKPNTTLGFWMPLEDATKDNGCLWVVPGGHTTTLRQLFSRDDSGDKVFFTTLDSTPFPEEEMVPVEMSKGSLLLIHSLLPHKSFANRSPRSRIAYTFHLIDNTCEYPSSNWLQRGPSAPLQPFE